MDDIKSYIGTIAPEVRHPPEWPVYTDDEVTACAELTRSGRTFDYGRGAEIAALEDIFARRYERRFSLALNSGTSALLAAYYAIGIEPGDEVLVPSFTFSATATPLLVLGAVPILCDAGCDTGNVTAASIAAHITPRTRAVAITHLWGHLCDMEPILDLCRAHNLPLVEDCSHAHGASLHSTIAGAVGDIAIFSVGGHKMISGGLGGVLLTDNQDIFGRACLLANFQKRAEASLNGTPFQNFATLGLGGNLRISPIAAFLAHSQMERIETLISVKRRNAEHILSLLSSLPGLKSQVRLPGANFGGWFGVNLHYDETATDVPLDHVLARLQARGLKVRRPHTKPLICSPLFSGNIPDWIPSSLSTALKAHYGDQATRTATAERVWNALIALPGNHLHEENSELPEIYAAHFHDVWNEFRNARR